MRLLGAILAGLLLAAAIHWWQVQQTEQAARRQARSTACARQPHRCDPPGTLYRWRDAAGVLQITEAPPARRRYERLARDPKAGMEVHGDRQDSTPDRE